MGLNSRIFGKFNAALTLISALGLLAEFAAIAYLMVLKLSLSPLQIAYYVAAVALVSILSGHISLARKRSSGDEDDLKVRFNVTISGEPAKWVREWKRRKLFITNRDILLRALVALHKEMIEIDLKNIELERRRREEHYEEGL